MAADESTWERVDLPVLRFVQSLSYHVVWSFDREGPTEELPDFEGEELDDALRRLEAHGLISWGDRSEAIGLFRFSRLRLTPDGLRILGEWPPAEEAQLGAALVQILRALADDADDADAKPLRRAAGAVGRFAGNVAFDVAKGELKSMGGDIGP